MNIDLITMYGNLSQSLGPVQNLIKWGAGALGVVFIVIALFKLKEVTTHGHKSSNEKMIGPIMYFLMGAVLLYLPTGIEVLSNTAFGVGNIMSYSPIGKIDVRDSVILLIRTIGLIWFVRGCVLIAHVSEPGNKHGLKGLLFLIAGVFAINYEGSAALLNWFMQGLIDATKSIKSRAGY
jgi:hypothetical protein